MSQILRVVALLLLGFVVGCSVRPEPAVQPLSARTWALPAEMTFEDAAATFRGVAEPLGYEVVEDRDGLFLRSPRFYANELDRYCVYPIINAKTGGRMHTFASWQAEMNRLASHRGRAFGLVEIQVLREQQPLKARTFCRAFTQLGIQPAESKGAYEEKLMGSIGATPL